MLVSTWISTMRRFVKDFPVLTGETFFGDGATTAFRTKFAPILEGQYTVKISGVTKTEGVDYTIDLDTGVVEFTTAPALVTADPNVAVNYKYAKLRDLEWLTILNAQIQFLRNKIWEDKLDDTNITTVAGQSEYDLDTIFTNIYKLVDVWYRSSANMEWTTVAGKVANLTYWRGQNKMNIRPSFSASGYYFKIRYLEHYSEYTATTDTIVIPDKYMKPIRYFCASEYLDELMALMVRDLGANPTKESYEALNNVRGLKKDWRQTAELLLSRVRPKVPASNIPTIKQGLQ